MNPQEQEMLERLGVLVDVEGEKFMGNVLPTQLAKVLVELQEKTAPIEHCGVEDCPECNKEAYRSGYLTALDDVERGLPYIDTSALFNIKPSSLRELLDKLRKNHKGE